MTTLTIRFIKDRFVVTGPDMSPCGSSRVERPRTGAKPLSGLTRSGDGPQRARPIQISRHGLVTSEPLAKRVLIRFGRGGGVIAPVALCANIVLTRWLQGTVEPEVKEAEVVDTSIVLLSPARLDGKRAHLLFHPVTMFPVARALHSTAGAPNWRDLHLSVGRISGAMTSADTFAAATGAALAWDVMRGCVE